MLGLLNESIFMLTSLLKLDLKSAFVENVTSMLLGYK